MAHFSVPSLQDTQSEHPENENPKNGEDDTERPQGVGCSGNPIHFMSQSLQKNTQSAAVTVDKATSSCQSVGGVVLGCCLLSFVAAYVAEWDRTDPTAQALHLVNQDIRAYYRLCNWLTYSQSSSYRGCFLTFTRDCGLVLMLMHLII